MTGRETAWPNWFTTKDLILSGVTGAAVVVGLGLGVVVVAVVGLAVVLVVGCLVVVVGLAVVLAVVVVVAVVVLAVVGGGVVEVVVVVATVVVVTVVVTVVELLTGLLVVWLTLAGRTTELALLAPLDLEDSTETEGFSVRISTSFTSSASLLTKIFSSPFLGWCSFLVGRKKVSENLSAVRGLRTGAAGWAGRLTGAGLITPNL